MMTYVTVNNKIFERLEDAQEYQKRISVGWDKSSALRAIETRKRDLQQAREAVERKLQATCFAEELASEDLRKALAAVEEAAKKAVPYGLFLYGQRPKEKECNQRDEMPPIPLACDEGEA